MRICDHTKTSGSMDHPDVRFCRKRAVVEMPNGDQFCADHNPTPPLTIVVTEEMREVLREVADADARIPKMRGLGMRKPAERKRGIWALTLARLVAEAVERAEAQREVAP